MMCESEANDQVGFLPGKYRRTDDYAKGDSRFSSTASLTETTAHSTPPTLTLSDDCHRDHIDDSFQRMSSSDNESSPQQQSPKREEEDTSCAKSVTPPSNFSLSSTSSSFSQEFIVTNCDNIISQLGHENKYSNSESPMTAVPVLP
jgi:hypothetical protein